MWDEKTESIVKNAFSMVFKNHEFEDKVKIKPSKYSSSIYIIPTTPPHKGNEYSFKISFDEDENNQEQMFLMVMREGNTWGASHVMDSHISSSIVLADFIEKVIYEEAFEEFYPRDLSSYWL